MKCAWMLLFLTCSAGADGAEVWGGHIGTYLGGHYITDGQTSYFIGATWTWEHFEIDISHGTKSLEWRTIEEDQWSMNEWQSGSTIGLRYYPFSLNNFRPFIIWDHQSDITRGRPFNDKQEPTSDFFGVGVTAEYKRLDVDLAYGRYARECALFDCAIGSVTNELYIRARVYFWK